jgi:hypothetical protein
MSFSWNHRVVEFDNGDGEKYYEICEVYYDEQDKPTGYCDAHIGSETLDGLKGEIARLSEALAHPVIKEKDLGVKYGVQLNEEE